MKLFKKYFNYFTSSVIIYIILLSLELLLVGCNGKVDSAKETSSKTTISKSNYEFYPFLNPNEVESLTMRLRFQFKTKVLTKETDENKIVKIVAMINRGSNKELISLNELGSYKVEPIGIEINMKAGNRIYVFQELVRVMQNGSFSITSSQDSFILKYERFGITNYYRIYSKEVPKYFHHYEEDMPVIWPKPDLK